jgi:hypothetical protein
MAPSTSEPKFQTWFPSQMGRVLFLSLCFLGLLSDWILFSNCGPAYFDEPVPCDSSDWEGKVFGMPTTLPESESTPVIQYQFLALSTDGHLSGLAMTPNGPTTAIQTFTYSIPGDSLHWHPRPKPFYATADGPDHSWLGCEGQTENGIGILRLTGQLFVPPGTCVPGKWTTTPTDSFIPYETLEYRDCILLGNLMDSLVWGACKPTIETSVDSLSTVIWSGNQISTEWTRLFAGRQIIEAKGNWVLTRKLESGSTGVGYRYAFEKWDSDSPSIHPLPEWKMVTAIALRQDGQVAAFAADSQTKVSHWYLLDSNQKEIAIPNWPKPSMTQSPFSDMRPSAGYGKQWIFVSKDGFMEAIDGPGRVRTEYLPIQSLHLTDIFFANGNGIAVLQAQNPSCAMRTGLYAFANPFP